MDQRFGDYVVHELIGEGGMASIHLAEKGGKRVALKRLLPEVQKDRKLVADFIREARLMRYLKHPNIAATIECGRVYDSYFIAMEYVPGHTLKQLVAQCALTVGTVPHEITLNLVAQICDALDYAHNAKNEHGNPLGIIHRDVSPANILISERGEVKLIDFGLAKAKGVSTQETAVGTIKGKFAYVAPEYMSGKLDPRADLWAVGVVMYELLTSRRLFDGPDPFETMTRIRKLPIPRPSLANPRVTPELDKIVMTALERDPARRWQSAAMMRDALRGVIAQPENSVTDAAVADWVSWVFRLPPGTEASGVSKLRALTKPPVVEATVVSPPPEMLPDPTEAVMLDVAWLHSDWVWRGVQIFLGLIALGIVIEILARC